MGKGILGRTKQLLIRWAQLGAFSPLMENGGNQEHRPWIFDNQTLEIYRQYAHHIVSISLIHITYKDLLIYTTS